MSRFNYFSEKELQCRCGCSLGEMEMDKTFMQKIIKIREQSGIVMPASSAIRCATHNNNVSSTGFNGPHLTGRAIDIRIYGERAMRLLEWAINVGITGIGISQKGTMADRFIHFDDLNTNPRPWIWSY